MATRSFWTSGSASHRRPPPIPQTRFSSRHSSTSYRLPTFLSNPTSSSHLIGGCRNGNQHTHPRRRLFAQLPPAPQPDPPPDNEPLTLRGLVEGVSRFQERVQIFFAVFVWMSLFFWYSAWNGRDKGGGGGGGGMSSKRSRSPFRR